MRIIFMGTPEFAVPTLKAVDEKENLIAIVTQPDRRSGRGKKITFSPVKTYALENDILCLQPKSVKDDDFVEKLKSLKADLIVVVAYGQILSKEVLSLATYGCINVHASLLPKYRGASPIHHAIINGDEKTGVSTMFMDIGLDTGDMLVKKEMKIEDDDNLTSLENKLSDLGAKALLETIDLIKSGKLVSEKQNDKDSSYATMLSKEMGLIDWSKTSKEIRNLIRGLNPWPGAYNYINGVYIRVWDADIVHKKYEGENGQLVEIIKNEGFIVKTSDSALLIKEVQAQGRKRMNSQSFLLGFDIDLNTIFIE